VKLTTTIRSIMWYLINW